MLAMADRVCADEQTATQKADTSVIAEGISSNPGAVDARTGTGELAETIEGLVGLPRDTGVFLGGVWVADANCLLTGGADPGKWSFNRLLIVGAGLDAEKLVGWPGGRLASSFCSSTVSTQINRLVAYRATILCLARTHYTVQSSTSFGGGRNFSIANSS